MEIQHIDNATKGYFKAVEDGKEAGLMTYTRAGDDKFIINHTEGSPEFKGVGMKLLNEAVAFARKKELKIIPLCPFAKKMFDRHEDIRDVLAH